MPDSDNSKAIKAAMPGTLESPDRRGPLVYDLTRVASVNGVDEDCKDDKGVQNGAED